MFSITREPDLILINFSSQLCFASKCDKHLSGFPGVMYCACCCYGLDTLPSIRHVTALINWVSRWLLSRESPIKIFALIASQKIECRLLETFATKKTCHNSFHPSPPSAIFRRFRRKCLILAPSLLIRTETHRWFRRRALDLHLVKLKQTSFDIQLLDFIYKRKCRTVLIYSHLGLNKITFSLHIQFSKVSLFCTISGHIVWDQLWSYYGNPNHFRELVLKRQTPQSLLFVSCFDL